MNCRGCGLYTKQEVLDSKNGLCSYCYSFDYTCQECLKDTDPSLFNKAFKLCNTCFQLYARCEECYTLVSKDSLTSDKICLRCAEYLCFCENCNIAIDYSNSRLDFNLCSRCLTRHNELLYKKTQLKNSIGFLNKVLTSLFLTSAGTIILRAVHQVKLSWMDIDFSVPYAKFIFALLTITHLFLSTLFINNLRELSEFKSSYLHRSVLQELSGSDNIFFNGFLPKASISGKWEALIRIKKDMNFLLLSLTFLSLIPSTALTTSNLAYGLSLGVIFAIANSLIATNWVFKMSNLVMEQNHRRYKNKALQGVG